MALHHVVLEEFAKSLCECGLVDITFRAKDGGFLTFNMKQVAESIMALLTTETSGPTLPPVLPPGR